MADCLPRRLHQVWHTRDLPPRLAENAAKVAHANPGWEQRLYDETAMSAYVAEHAEPEVVAAFEALNPAYRAARADLFRYVVLHREGGVYLDLKSRPTRPLDEVLRRDESFVLAQWRNGPGEPFEGFGLHRELRVAGGEFQQWHIIAAPGHPFLAAVIARVVRNVRRYNPGLHGVGQLGVLRVTGPIAYTKAIAPLVDTYPCRRVDSAAELGFEYSIFGREGHRQALGRHYSELTEPVVRVGPAAAAAGRVLSGLRGVKRAVVGDRPIVPALGG